MFDASIVSQLLYAASAWCAYLSSADVDCLQNILDKAKRCNVFCNDVNIVDMFDKSDKLIFKTCLCPNHCLHHLLPSKRHHAQTMSVRPRGYD